MSYLLRTVAMKYRYYTHNVLDKNRRGVSQDLVIYHIAQQKGLHQKDLATKLNIKPASVSSIVNQMEATLDFGKSNIDWYSKEINEAIYSQPYIKPALIGKIAKRKSRTTLTNYMSELVSNGILTPRKEGKEVYYLNNNLIRILEQ